MAVLPFEDIRKNYIFVNRPVLINAPSTGPLRIPCIVLYEKGTMYPICYPKLELWYLDDVQSQADSTLRRRAGHICSFLNFYLWQTRHEELREMDMDDLANWMISFRTLDNGTERTPDGWRRGVEDVFRFLLAYAEGHPRMQFAYRSSELEKVLTVDEYGRKKQGRMRSLFGVKPPTGRPVKQRFLLPGYLDLLLMEARLYDPMLRLGIALQSYAGLREGEVVNLTRASVDLQPGSSGGHGFFERICIDLNQEAPFSRDSTGKTEFGSIKKYRSQYVYPDFVDRTKEIYEEHERLLASLGASEDAGAPLFLNAWGRPLGVSSYTGRVKKLFREHFVPDLREVCESEGTLMENLPYIELWEKGSYPGAHMFRHWFTMYLMKCGEPAGSIMKWRGDSSLFSQEDYLHLTGETYDDYRRASAMFHAGYMEEILERRQK